MARPRSRDELLTAAAAEYAKLQALIAGMSDAERTAPLNYGPDFAKPEAHWARDANLRDVVVHLHEWHQLLLQWVAANLAGESRPFLPAPYTWKNYGEMNESFTRRHASTQLPDALRLLDTSHAAVVELITERSEAELFERGHYTWTGTTTLGSYCVAATSSHYVWAAKKLRAALRVSRASGGSVA